MKARITLPNMFQLLVTLALLISSVLPLGAVKAEDGWEFSASVQVRNNDTGYVEINGIDTRGPEIAFTFEWGDGTREETWFPASHIYADTSQDYTVTITSHYDDGSSAQITVSVPFSEPQNYNLQAWVEDIQLLTGDVRINGFVEGAVGLLLFDWGDGESTESLFPATHRYADTTGNYTIKVSGLYSNNESAYAEVLVDFINAYYPKFEVWTTLQPYRIRGFGWPFGRQVLLTIDDPVSGEVYHSATLFPVPASWNPDEPIIDYEVGEGLLLAGRRVTLDDGGKPRELIISDVIVTNVDVVADTVEGTASPGTRIETWWCADAGAYCATRRMIANNDGYWFADFAHPVEGDVPDDEKVTIDILPYVYSIAQVLDEDGDATFIHWYGETPIGGESVGNGWINSPAGAYSLNLSAAGKGIFNFTAKYPKDSEVPVGKLKFQLKAGGISFVSTELNWLVIAGSKVQFRGLGTLNGKSNYWFLLTAFDNGAGGHKDQLRFQIYDDTTGELIYDNLLDPIESDFPLIGGGNIKIKKSK